MVNRKELNPDSSPQAALGARLRKMREDRGWKQTDLGTLMGYSATHVSSVEIGFKSATLRFVRSADQALKVTGTDQSFEREWREIKHGSLLEGFPEYVQHEGRASEIRLFELGLIPGPLQAREYAVALAESAVARGTISADQAEERVSILMKRQAALSRPTPPDVMVVLDESCVRRPVGGGAVMGEQLKYLLEFAELPHTVLQVVPYRVGERRPLDRPVNLLTMPDRSVLSYVESQTHGQVDRELTSVVPLVRDYHQTQAVALSQAATIAMIDRLRKGASR